MDAGNGALKENYFLDDGAYLIAKILIKIAKLKEENKTVDAMIKDLKEPLETKEFRMNIHTDDFKAYGNNIIADLNSYATDISDWHPAPDNYEGIRVSFDKENGDVWFLLRLSLHDPLMPLNIESNTSGSIKIIASKLLRFLEKYDKLDIKSLKEVVR